MDTQMEDRELAETMIILTGEGAHDAAMQFAADCHELGNEVLAELWERVVAAIDMIARAAKPLVAAIAGTEPESDGIRVASARQMSHLAYDSVAAWPRARGDLAAEGATSESWAKELRVAGAPEALAA